MTRKSELAAEATGRNNGSSRVPDDIDGKHYRPYGDCGRAAADAERREIQRRQNLITRRLADVEAETLEWLWPGRIPLGKLTLLAGDPGLGKSFLTLDVAARVSRGAPWPDLPDEQQSAGTVILMSAEDDLADTIRPRLDRAAADVKRIISVEGSRSVDDNGQEHARGFSLRTDVDRLDGLMQDTEDVRLVVIDPISAYLGEGTDSHKNSDIRALLAPLAELAGRHRAAVLCVTHLSKGGSGKAVYRAMGSLAFAAAARAVWAVTKDQQDHKRRLILPVKLNLAPDPTGLAYTIMDGYVAWESTPISITADEALDDASDQHGGTSAAWKEAADWLAEVLKDGPVATKEVQALARDNGVREKALRTAREKLNVRCDRDGFGRGSRMMWSLPAQAPIDAF